MLPSVQFKQVLDLTPYLKGREIISEGICFDGSLAVLVVEPEAKDLPFARTEQGIGNFPRSTSKESFVMSLLRFGDDPNSEKQGNARVNEIELAPSASSYPQVQMFPDNSILVARSRCSLRADGPELNATIYSEKGEVLRHFCLGDGIQDLKVSPSGEIWVSYFDEGICGNFGWTEDAIGAPGINCFDKTGEKIWCFEALGDIETIDDCYAMSIVGDEVVACYYSDFPIIRISKDKQITAWHNQVAGANAIAVCGDKVLLYGGYEEPSRCILQTLGKDGIASDLTQIALSMPDKFSGETVSCHDSDLHVVVDSRWYRLRLDV
ncbi:hypothetical protein BH11CYA1_BH11CYA1_16340 [soil metagenome]